jgi:hypothetical protein
VSVDIPSWRKVIEQVVDSIADEAHLRRAWLGIGPEMGSPEDTFCQFFDDVAIVAFLERSDTGLSETQIEAGKHLVKLMRNLSDQLPT